MLSELLSWESKWVLLVWWKLLINVMYCCGIFWANWTGFWLFSENCWWMLLCIIVDYIGLTELGFGCLVKIVGDCALPMWNLVEIFLGSREEKINSWIVFTFLSGKFPQMCVVLVEFDCWWLDIVHNWCQWSIDQMKSPFL